MRAMQDDLRHWRNWTGPRSVSSVHFGGGTPSLMTMAQLSDCLGTLDNLWGIGGAEIAIEANPDDIQDRARIDGWAELGLTRVSVGVQSFDDAVLARLGRRHSGNDAKTALEHASKAGLACSADLIFGVAGESEGRLNRDIDTLLDLAVGHISTYQLTIEPGTAFARRKDRGDVLAYDADDSARDYDLIRDRLMAEGYRHYEVSNFARPGQESRHNLAYWRGWDYVGVGPGAHGRLWQAEGRMATETALKPADYIAAVSRSGHGMTHQDVLSSEDAAVEYVMMGLRISEGLSISELSRIRGSITPIDPDLLEAGFLKVDGDKLMATDAGRPVLDALTRQLLL